MPSLLTGFVDLLRKPLLWWLAAGLLVGMSVVVGKIATIQIHAWGMSGSSSSTGTFYDLTTDFLYPFGVTFGHGSARTSSNLLLVLVAMALGLCIVGLILRRVSGPFQILPAAALLAIAGGLILLSQPQPSGVTVDAPWPAVIWMMIVMVGMSFVAQWLLLKATFLKDLDRVPIWQEWGLSVSVSSSAAGQRRPQPVTGQARGGDNGYHPASNGNSAGFQAQPVAGVAPATMHNPLCCAFCGHRSQNLRSSPTCPTCKMPVKSLPAVAGDDCTICGAQMSKTGQYCPNCGKDRVAQQHAAATGF